MSVCVIFNPKARGEKAQRLRHFLEKHTSCRCFPTTFAGEARPLAARAIVEGYDTIVAAGGDGTLNEVVNGFGDVPEGFEKARLGVLPMGTINVFARELNLPFSIEKAWTVISQNREIQIDLPCSSYLSNGQQVKRHFMQLAGAGLDAHAVAKVNWNLKKKIGPLAYVAAGFQALAAPQSTIRVTTSTGKIAEGELVLIGNGKLYGGSFKIFPLADLQDGELDICVIPKVNWWVLARTGIGFATGNFHRFSGAISLRSPSISLDAGRDTFFQLDGENAGKLPAKLWIEPRKIRVLFP